MTPAAKPKTGAGARFEQIPLAKIMEPAIPIRESMDDTKFRELRDSIAASGLWYPVLLVPRGAKFEIVDGHRRFLACRDLKWAAMPSLVYPQKGLAVEAARLGANVFREDMTAAEEATWFAQLVEVYKLNEAELCDFVHHSADYIGDRLRLLRGDSAVFEALRRRDISFATARELNKITDQTYCRYYLHQALASGCSSRVVAQWVAQWKAQGAPSTSPAPAPAEPATGEPAPAYVCSCFWCGGSKDPWNLESVHIHRWCREGLEKASRKAAEQGE